RRDHRRGRLTVSDTTDTDQAGASRPGPASPTPGDPLPPGAQDEPGPGPESLGAQDGVGQPIDYSPLHVETLVATMETVTAERDSHLADLQRLSAEFSNFRRQATKRQTDTVEHAAGGLAAKLLPVLDACDAALQQGATDVEPIRLALLDTLRKEGLEVLTDSGEAFDPERHEAVMHEPGDDAEPTVAEVVRTGYVWNGRVLRPAMVRVRG
ncbi:MAG: nucleotide exchange factor GrpE, partial [Acidimicrobiales bacterium]